jgi:SAM-dependent methyltransferase
VTNFKDHFSTQSAGYAAHRPTYPPALFEFLSGLCTEHTLALDCATGSGQAALGLAEHFKQVIATDASAEQIAAAQKHPRIEYRIAPAEASALPEHSVDLLSAAQAAHWFDLPAFHQEARRVLKPGGVIALWCYERLSIEPALDAVIEAFYNGAIGPYWPPERGYVERGYRDLDFPYDELPTPTLTMTADWNLEQLLGYFGTWSAVKRYRQACGNDPLPALGAALAAEWVWPDAAKPIKWPLSLRLGRIPPRS